jgi:integrase
MGYQNSHYLNTKRGVYYYTRRVPQSLQAQFESSRFVKCLHTRSQAKAFRLSQELSSRLENIWDRMRLEVLDFKTDETRSLVLGVGGVSTRSIFRISDGFELYLRLKASTKPASFKTYTDRNERYLLECLGDINMEDLSPRNGAEFRDYLINRRLSTASVRRVFSTVKSVINLSISERGLGLTNPFAKVFIPDDGRTVKRQSIPIEIIRNIQAECRAIDDDQRWLTALISDTGMRLSEACGLLVDDIKLDTNIPFLDIKPHPWRRLKTSGSERQVPLVGASLWAAKQIINNGQSKLVFPRYCTEKGVKANSASGALNKWLSQRVPKGCVIHSFRHSFRDRLRDVQCPADIIDVLGGWVSSGLGESYGNGHNLTNKSKWMNLIGTQ